LAIACRGHGRVESEVLVDSEFGGFLDVVGSIKIGFADREVDNIYTLGA
jgi:hypothetical protein